MKTLVVGAGAIGGYFGSRLLAAGGDVTFLVRARRAEQLRRTGMQVISPLGDLSLPTPPLASAGQLDGNYDLILLSCKAYDLQASIEDFAPAMGPGSKVLPLLNGMSHLDALDSRFGRERVLGGLARISGTLDSEGRIVHMGRFQSFAFGARDPASQDQMPALEAALRAPGFEALLSRDIVHEMWEKWVFIAAAAATTCLMRATVGDLVNAGASEIATGMLEECGAIAAVNQFAPRPTAAKIGISVLTEPGSSFTASMLRDIEQGARIEADHIVGDLLKRRGSAAAPLLSTAYAHLRSYEARRKRESAAKTS
jgi:2-dehydropantoate 2-reductase